MTATTLFMCLGISWLGCGVVSVVDYGSEEACHRALQKMVVQQNGAQATGGDGRQMVAYCRPPYPDQKK